MYDIDKVYAIMAAINRNGIYKDFSPYELTSYDTITNPEVNLSSEEIMINNELAALVQEGKNADITEIVDKIDKMLKITNIRLIKDYINSTFYRKSILSVDVLNNLNKANNRRLVNVADYLIKKIENELTAKSALEKTNDNEMETTQNYILESIKNIYRDPRTLVATTDPTTMDPVNNTVERFNLESERRNHWNFMTDINLNQTTAVGAKDIGIAAVAQKAFYALTYYYHKKQEEGNNIANYIEIKLPKDWQLDVTTLYSIGFPGQVINQASIDYLINVFEKWKHIDSSIDDIRTVDIYNNGDITVKIIKETIDNKTVNMIQILNKNGESEDIYVGRKIGKWLATTINSALISSSTDNAKEMQMDLLNATPEILPIYEYLLSLGIDLEHSAKILTDPLIKVLITIARGDLFTGEKSIRSIYKIVTTDKYRNRIKTLLANYISEVDDVVLEQKLQILAKFAKGAEELTILGQSLGINGGIKVEIGSPILYQLRFENNVNQVVNQNYNSNDDEDQKSREYINFERFMTDNIYAQEWVDKYEEHKSSFNLLDLIQSVPHYKEMFTVPVQFKRSMQLLSKDIDSTYTIIERELSKNTMIDDKTIRTVLRAINDQKIFNFFLQDPIEYESPFCIKRINNSNDTEKQEFDKGQTKVFKTNTFDGLATLKAYIEDEIINKLKTKYKDNEKASAFFNNLVPNSIYSTLFNERIPFVGSRINLSDPQFSDVTAIIKDSFYSIQDEIINGKTVYEWMFIYDLLVHKHTTSSSSITLLLDDRLKLKDKNSIVSRWVRFVNKYDKMPLNFSNLKEITNLPNLKDTWGRDKKEAATVYEDMIDDMYDPIFNERLINRASWLVNPDYLPLYVSTENFGIKALLSRGELLKAISRQNIYIKNC